MTVVLLTHADDWEAGAARTYTGRSVGLPVLRRALEPVLRSAVPPAGLARVADEVEQRLVDLIGVSPDDRVRAASDDGGAGVLQQRGKLAAGDLVGQDAILVAVNDQDGDADRGQIAAEVFQAGCAVTQRSAAWADAEMATLKLFCHAWSLTRSRR